MNDIETTKAAMQLWLAMMDSKRIKGEGNENFTDAAANFRYTLAAAKILEAIELLQKI